MRSPIDCKTLVGGLALLATFVLALPGVKAVRAGDPEWPLASSDGPTCNAPSPEADMAHGAAALEQIRQQVAAQIDPSLAGEIVVLNGRGYNYGPASSLERATLDLERLRAEH